MYVHMVNTLVVICWDQFMRVQYMVTHMVRIEVYIPSGIRRLDNLFEFLIV